MEKECEHRGKISELETSLKILTNEISVKLSAMEKILGRMADGHDKIIALDGRMNNCEQARAEMKDSIGRLNDRLYIVSSIFATLSAIITSFVGYFLKN